MENIHFTGLPEGWKDVESYAWLWLKGVAQSEGFRLVRLNYVFLSDESMREANRRHLNHDYYTDVITFNDVRGKRVIGDVLVSVDRILENSKMLNNSVLDERDRVLVHALLHLCGYEDKNEVEELKMRELEDKYLALRP